MSRALATGASMIRLTETRRKILVLSLLTFVVLC